MPRRGSSTQYTPEELALIQAQVRGAEAEAGLREAQTGDVAAERAQRAETVRQAAEQLGVTRAESQAKIANVQEMTPIEKLLKLSQANEPATRERTARMGTAIDLMKLRDVVRASREQNTAGLAQQLVQSRPDIDLETLGTALKDVYPGLSAALTASKTAKTQTAANVMSSQIGALKKAGNVKGVEALMAGLPAEVQEELRRREPTPEATPEPTPEQPTLSPVTQLFRGGLRKPFEEGLPPSTTVSPPQMLLNKLFSFDTQASTPQSGEGYWDRPTPFIDLLASPFKRKTKK
jgi:hypothetical protein